MLRSATTTVPRSALPPSAPGGDLLLGSARDFQRDALEFMQTLAQMGDVVRYRFVIWPSCFLNHPDHIKHVLQENNRNYNKEVLSNQILKTVLGTGLLTNDGESWLSRRRLIQPAFHRQRIAAFGALMTASTGELLQRWDARSDTDAPVDLAAEMMGLTLRIVGLSLFGTEMGGAVDTVGRSFTTVNNFLTRAMYQPYIMLPGMPARGKRRFRQASQELDEIVYQVIAQRRQAESEQDDLLSMLMHIRDADTGESMDDHQLHDEVITLLLAGHETTAIALTWTWYLLAAHPDVEYRLRAELESVLGGRVPTSDDLAHLPYTRNVIDEAIRLYPPAWSVLRRAIGDDEIGPYHIPARTSIFISPYAVHRHPDFWDQPEVYDPDRFSPERSAGRPHFAYIPFGGGPRQCIGNAFALTEAQLILATVAQRYRLSTLPGQTVKPNPLITLRPQGGLPVLLERLV